MENIQHVARQYGYRAHQAVSINQLHHRHHHN